MIVFQQKMRSRGFWIFSQVDGGMSTGRYGTSLQSPGTWPIVKYGVWIFRLAVGRWPHAWEVGKVAAMSGLTDGSAPLIAYT